MSDIKIFVSHRIDMDTGTFNNPLFVPIKSGAALEKRALYEMTGDNTGENISEKNRRSPVKMLDNGAII